MSHVWVLKPPPLPTSWQELKDRPTWVSGGSYLVQMCLRKEPYHWRSCAYRGIGEGGLPARGAQSQGVGCPRVSGTCEPGVCPAFLRSPGELSTEDPGGVRVRCARALKRSLHPPAPLPPPPKALTPNRTLMRPWVVYISWLYFVHRWIVPLISPNVIVNLSWEQGSAEG